MKHEVCMLPVPHAGVGNSVADLVRAAQAVNCLQDAVFVFDHDTGLYGVKLFSGLLSGHGSPEPVGWYIKPYFEGDDDSMRRELERLRWNASAKLDAEIDAWRKS